MPAEPAPTIATVLPVWKLAGCGRIQPFAHALSAIACSMVLMETGTSSRLRVHASSHGAGQTRPVNSGKLLVECRSWAAACQSSL